MQFTRVGPLLLLFLVIPSVADGQDYGVTSFENSGAEEAQDEFLRGVLMLHSFEYPDAREAFQAARKIDPGFAMAYWGEAMTHNHPVWFRQDREAGRRVLNELRSTAEERMARAATERERDYLQAADVLYGEGSKEERDFAYAEEMKRLSEKYPDDLDAKAFLALALLGTSHGGRDFRTYMRAAAIAEEVFDANPRHPGAAHYLIHSYDDPVHAPLGLRAARQYSQIAPAAAHALHMPAHIFVAMGMWDDVVATNEASWAASEDRIKAKNLGLEARGYHALHWLAYGYLQQGRYSDARRVVEIMEDSHARGESRLTGHHLAVIRAAYVAETGEIESRAARLEVDPSSLGLEGAAAELFTRGLVAIGKSDASAGEEAAAGIRAHADFDGADNTSRRAEATALQLEALAANARGESSRSIELLSKAAEIVDAVAMDYGPPFPVVPVHEMLGDILLEAGRSEEARAAFEKSLEQAPGRARSLFGYWQASAASGLNREAALVERDLRSVWSKADAVVLSRLDSPASGTE